MKAVVSLIATGAMLVAREAGANYYDMYRADYTKTAFCQAIGAACASDTDPENSFFQNPASLEADNTDLVFDGDYNTNSNLEPGMKGNNDVSEYAYMGGIAKPGKKWGMGVALSGRTDVVNSKATIADDSGATQNVNAKDRVDTVTVNIPVAWKLSKNLSIGVGLSELIYREQLSVSGATNAKVTPIDRIPLPAFSFGAIYGSKSLRIGSWVRTSTTYYFHQTISAQTLAYFVNIDEDVALHWPWMWDTGFSVMPWQDDRTFFLDFDIIGQTQLGFERTYDTFTSSVKESGLRAKGRSTVLEPHVGWRSPWWHGSKGTYMLGAYYETSRWDGVSSRVHGTAGLAFKAFDFVEFMAGIDVSRDFFSLLLTFR